MMNMIKADLYRIVRSKVVYAGIALMLLMIGASIYGVSPGSIGIHSDSRYDTEYMKAYNDVFGSISYEEYGTISMSEYRKLMLSYEGYELDRDILGSNINLYYCFIFIAAVVIVADFSQKTAKNTLSSAISRNRYFFSKLAIVNLCCVALFFLNTYIVYVSNIIFNSKNLASSLGTVTKISILQLPVILALVSILAGFGFVLRKAAWFNAVAIPFQMLFVVALSQIVMIFGLPEKYLDYELQNMLYLLANHPSGSYLVRSYLVCGGVMVLFYLIGYLIFRKSEIK